MKLLVKKGATSYLVGIFIQDSSKTDGSGLTGLTSGSAGLVCYRARSDDGNAGGTQITLSAGTRGTWSSGGFVEKDATNMPGVYELGIPNAAIATGSNYAIIMLKGATNMATLPLEIQLTDFDPQDATAMGMSRLDTTVSSRVATTSLPTNFSSMVIDSNGRVDVSKVLGAAINALISGRIDANAQVVGDKTGYALTQTFPTNFSSLAIDGSGDVTASGLTAAAIASILATAVDGTFTWAQVIRIVNSALAGVLAGAATTTETIKDLANTKTRITATVDANGNRTAVTFNDLTL